MKSQLSLIKFAALAAGFSLVTSCADDGTAPDSRMDADAADTGATNASDADTGDTGSTDAGQDQQDVAGPPPDRCISDTTLRYDPFESETLLAWPDDVYTIPDPESPTGIRVSLALENTPWRAEIPNILEPVAEDMGELSGFGANAAAVLRFDAPPVNVPVTEEESLQSDAILWLDLSTTPPTRVPYEAILSDEGKDVILWPLRPLTLGAQHALLVTSSLLSESGCIAPSTVTSRILDGNRIGEAEAALGARWDDAIARAEIAPGTVTGILAFTVHDDLWPVLAAADDILDSESIGWATRPVCTGDGRRKCEGTIVTVDYRSGRHVATGAPGDTWEIDVTIWLPEGEGAHPWVVFGHGIASRRTQGNTAAEELAELGIAMVAIDAVAHGSHPTSSGDTATTALDFLGIDLAALQLDPLRLRGNFDQTNLDRLQLIEIIRRDPDVDGDGEADLDPEKAGYWGISLGGMLGASLTALSPDIEASLLSVAGGRLLQFATDTARVKEMMPIVANLVGSMELLLRLIPVAQSIVDPADPATWAPRVLTRYPPPSVLLPVALHDDTVPPACGRALARALGIPQTGEAFVDVEVIPLVPAPLSGNVGEAEATAAYMQYDRVSNNAEIVAATHDNLPHSVEAATQTARFFSSWLSDSVPEIVDPYAELGTSALTE